jgi:hypothetical protein
VACVVNAATILAYIKDGKYCSVLSRCYATTSRWADIPGHFLGNGSVNTFPLLGISFLIMQKFD